MRMACLAVLAGVALAACDREPTFDASSLPAYQKSLAEITARLNKQDQRRLQLALLTLAVGQAADYTAFGLANPASLANVETLDNVANPLIFLDRMRPQIAGRTAASVIRHVADDLDYAIARGEEQTKGADKVLATFVIENPTFHWDRSHSGKSTMEFSVYNGSNNPISAIYLRGELTTRDLASPVAFGSLQYRFAHPLQPGAQETVKVFLRPAGDWTTKQLDNTYDADVKLKVSNVADAEGKPRFIVNADVLDSMRRKRDALRGS